MYLDETERISGRRQRRTERLAAAAARRSRELGVAYSLSMAASAADLCDIGGAVGGLSTSLGSVLASCAYQPLYLPLCGYLAVRVSL